MFKLTNTNTEGNVLTHSQTYTHTEGNVSGHTGTDGRLVKAWRILGETNTHTRPQALSKKIQVESTREHSTKEGDTPTPQGSPLHETHTHKVT